MLLLLRKAHHLILYGRTITRPDTLYNTGIERGTIEATTDHLVGSLVGIGDMAGDLGTVYRCCVSGERLWRVIARLRLEN
jgi:hypothetical protein